MFAILGLRALFFALSGIMRLFEYLHYGLAAILVFVGIKMLVSDWIHLPVWIALIVIAVILTVTIVASVLFPKNERKQETPAPRDSSAQSEIVESTPFEED